MTKPPKAIPSQSGEVTSDSANYRISFYGILNAQGDFWTPLAFDDPKNARQYINDFWGGEHTEKAQQCLRTHKIVPVRIRLEKLTDEDQS